MFINRFNTSQIKKIQSNQVNTNWRDVQRENVVNNVYMSSLRAPWQNGSHTDKHTEQ